MQGGTGNYTPHRARLYTDFGLLTCDPDFGHDATELFNYLTTGYKPKRDYHKLLVAPKLMKPALLRFIKAEIEHQRAGTGGHIQFKMNALEDVDITRALYEASQAGVSIDLIVRDTCRLRPGIPGLSNTARVVSIVGRFLEHTRVYYFKNGGEERYYLGSADTMKRNLESRVEVLAPVERPELQAELRRILDIQLSDERSAWDMQPDGAYVQRTPAEPDTPSSQVLLIASAESGHKKATRLKKRKIKRGPKRNRGRN